MGLRSPLNPIRIRLIPALLLCLLGLPTWGLGIALAQDVSSSEELGAVLDRTESGLEGEGEGPLSEPLRTGNEPLGIVQEIYVTGLFDVRPSVIRRQLTFKIGDTYTDYHGRLSEVRLSQLGYLSRPEVTYEVIGAIPPGEPTERTAVEGDSEETPSEEGAEPEADVEVEGDETAPEPEIPAKIDPNRPLKITVTVFEYQRTWQVFPYGISEPPYLYGALALERDLLQTGDELSFGVFSLDDLEIYSLTYEDTQFGGGHHRASFNLQLADSAISIRDETNFDTGDSYYLSKDGLRFTYNSTHNGAMRAWWGAELYTIETDRRSGTLVNDDKTFLLSGAEIDDGTLVYLNAGVGQSRQSGYPLTNEGWAWSAETNQSLEALGSLATFGRYKLSGSVFVPVDKRGDCVAMRVKFDTSSGDIPHYERPLGGVYTRGYSGVGIYGRSALTINTEARIMIDPEIGQVVLFYDLGKGYDSATPNLDDLEYGYGVGVRLRTIKWVPFNAVIFADYAIGAHDNVFHLGLGQWF